MSRDRAATVRSSIRPGEPWLDTDGNRIHAHGGSIFTDSDGTFYWYGENKEHTTPGSGYFPNPSEFASAPGYHGPWTVLGTAHPGDDSRTSFRSQISSVFRHPTKKDLYIALADRWLPQLPEDMPNVYDAIAARMEGRPRPEGSGNLAEVMAAGSGENTAIADYVWLPILFDGDVPVIDWHDEWRIEDFEDIEDCALSAEEGFSR